MIDDHQIEEIVQRTMGKIDRIANDLVDAALEAGGKDNISLIVCMLKG